MKLTVSEQRRACGELLLVARREATGAPLLKCFLPERLMLWCERRVVVDVVVAGGNLEPFDQDEESRWIDAARCQHPFSPWWCSSP